MVHAGQSALISNGGNYIGSAARDARMQQKKDKGTNYSRGKDTEEVHADRQNLVGLKLWVCNVWLDLLDNRHRNVVLVKGSQALQEVVLHQHLLASL